MKNIVRPIKGRERWFFTEWNFIVLDADWLLLIRNDYYVHPYRWINLYTHIIKTFTPAPYFLRSGPVWEEKITPLIRRKAQETHIYSWQDPVCVRLVWMNYTYANLHITTHIHIVYIHFITIIGHNLERYLTYAYIYCCMCLCLSL